METRVFISVAKERMLERLVSSRENIVDGFLALRSVLQRDVGCWDGWYCGR